MYGDKGGETTDSHRQVCVSCWTKPTTDFPAGLGEIIQALNDTSNQLWEVFRNMPLEQTRTTFQSMPAISRGLEPRKLLRYCYYINSKIKASRQTLPQWKIKPTSAFLWTSTLHGPLVHVREIWVRCANNPSYYKTINFPALTPKTMTSDSVNYAVHWLHHIQLAQLVLLLFPYLEHCDDWGDRDLPGTLCSHVLSPQRTKLCLIHNKNSINNFSIYKWPLWFITQIPLPFSW